MLESRKLKKHGGDIGRLASPRQPSIHIQRVLAVLKDPDIDRSITALHQKGGHVLLSTVAYEPGVRERYTLTRLHATGGVGQVWLARDGDLGRDVALKELRPERADSPSFWARFLEEAKITGQLEHPGIVPIYELSRPRDGQHPFYTMRFVRGRTLTEAARAYHGRRKENTAGPLELRELLGAFVGVCQAVAYAHSRGVIHRDLKGQNVVLGDYGEVMVLDWGLAKLLGRVEAEASRPPVELSMDEARALTMQGRALGTPAYMPPEQAEGRLDLVDERSDVYGLGAILYEVLTGLMPFDGSDTDEVLKKVINDQPARPRAVNSQAPPALEAICLKALAKHQSERYAGAKELAHEVQRWLADEPVTAYREPLNVRLSRWRRRHPALVAGAAALLLTATAGLAVGLFFVNAEKNRTELARRDATEQAELARVNEQAAKQNAEISQAVLDFVENKVFAAARPEGQDGGRGYDVKLRDAINDALPFVTQSFLKQPLIEARLRITMGLSFLYLGYPKKGAELCEAAHKLYFDHRGPDHPDTLVSMNNLANSYSALGRHAEALKLREDTLRLRKATLGTDDPLTLSSMHNLAVSYHDLGRPAEAFELLQETLALQKIKLGPEHHETLQSMNHLAVGYHDVGRLAESLELLKETLALQKTKLGPDHPDTLASMSNLAVSYYALGRYADALELNQAVLPARKAKLGVDHPDTLSSMNNLGSCYIALGRHAEALELREETLGRRKIKLGPDHADTLSSMHNLANSYDALGRQAEALELRKETLKLQKAKLGADHADTLSSINNLANSYVSLGRHAEAVKLYEETLAVRKGKLGPDHPDTLWSMNNLANCYDALGRHAEAVKLHEETLALRKAKLGTDHPDAIASMLNLATSYDALGRYADALELNEETLAR